MIKTILVPTDFSKNAGNAIEYAAEFAKTWNANLILLHAFRLEYSTSYVPFDQIAHEIEKKRNESNRLLQEVATRIEDVTNIKCRVVSVEDLAVDAILKVAYEEACDLIVMGTKGAGNTVETIIGSNTSAVIEKAGCPVFAIPEKAHFRGLQSIAFATDYHQSDLHVLQKLVEIIKPFKSAVRLVHIPSKDEKTAREDLMIFTRDISERTAYDSFSYSVLPVGNVQEQLEKFIQESDVELLVMAIHQRALFEKLFRKNLTKKMVYHAAVPLLVFHEKE